MSAASNQQPITIQLPTQPQPVQGVKTVTYVNPVISKAPTPQQQVSTVTTSANLQPLRVTQYAYTQSGTFENLIGYLFLKKTYVDM